jgi:hypothetical protein
MIGGRVRGIVASEASQADLWRGAALYDDNSTGGKQATPGNTQGTAPLVEACFGAI